MLDSVAGAVSQLQPILSLLYDVAVVLLTHWRLLVIMISVVSILWSIREDSIFGVIFGVAGLLFSIFIKWEGDIFGT